MLDLTPINGFEWDEGNIHKILHKHNITMQECESIFNNIPLYFFTDEKHSLSEQRFGIFSRTSEGKLLAGVFTIRNNKIRLISARPQSRKERKFFLSYEKSNPQKNSKI
jgi:uncharacterized DUF497 family protein